MGIEPTSQAWEARILPMNYTRIGRVIITHGTGKCNQNHSTFFQAPFDRGEVEYYTISYDYIRAGFFVSRICKTVIFCRKGMVERPAKKPPGGCFYDFARIV